MIKITDVRVCKVFMLEPCCYMVTWKYDGRTFQGPCCDAQSGGVVPWKTHPTRFEVEDEIMCWARTCGFELDMGFSVEPCREKFRPVPEDFEAIVDNHSLTKPLEDYSVDLRHGVFVDVWYSPWRHGYVKTEVAQFSRDPSKFWRLRRHFSSDGAQSAEIEEVTCGKQIPHWVWKKEES